MRLMKLYARLENEKGKVDGMGANEYLDIYIMVGNQKIAAFTVRKVDDAYTPPHDKRQVWGIFNADDECIVRSSIEA